MLENVANSLRIDRGAQFNAVRSSLEDAGYVVQWRIVCPKDIGVPVGRRRLYIVAVRTDLCFEFAWPTPQVHPIRLLDIIGPVPPGAHLNEPPGGGREAVGLSATIRPYIQQHCEIGVCNRTGRGS